MILIKWDSQVISNWMWLQFALYVKSKSRLFWKSQILSFFPNSDVAVVHSSQGRFSFFRHIVKNTHERYEQVISGTIFLKNCDIWSDFIKVINLVSIQYLRDGGLDEAPIPTHLGNDVTMVQSFSMY